VTDINRSLAATLKLCGPAALTNGENVIAQITAQVQAILVKSHPCQQDPGDEEDAELLDEISEYDWLVIETAMEVVTCLAAALGETFSQGWKEFERPILKYASSQEHTERSAAVGTIAECIGNMGSGVTPHTVGLMKVLLHRIGDEDPETRSNAVYGIGLLCEKSGNDKEVLSNYAGILSKLEPLLHGQQSARILDNSAGCVSRMIAMHKDQVPLQEVLPSLVQLLPLREDFEENEPIFRMIVQLCKMLAFHILSVLFG
jgi:importin-4